MPLATPSPVQPSPVQATPVQATPVQAAPVQATPVQEARDRLDQTPTPPVGTNRLMIVIGLGYCLLASTLSMPSALPEVRRTIRMSDTVTSLHGSFFGWGLVLGSLFGSGLILHLGRQRTIIAAVVAMGLGAGTFATGTTVFQTLLGAAFAGLGAAALVIVVPGLVADAFGDRRTEVFNKVNVAPGLAGFSFPLAVAGAPLIGLNWRWPTAGIPLLFLVAMIVACRPVLGIRTGAAASSSAKARDVLRPLKDNPYVRRRFLLQVLQVTLEFSLGVWQVTYLRENVGFTRSMAPLGAAAAAFGIVSSRSLVPRLIALLGRRLEAACFGAFGAGALTLLFTRNHVLAILAIAVSSFAIGPTYTLTVERMFLRSTSPTLITSSLSAVASGVAITIGPLLVGTLSDIFSLRTALLCLPLGAAFGMYLCVNRWGDEAGSLGQHVTD